MEKILAESRNLVAEVAAFIRGEASKSARVSMKSLNNLVTETDEAAERKLIEGLSSILPQSVFIAEEGTTEWADGEYQWIDHG